MLNSFFLHLRFLHLRFLRFCFAACLLACAAVGLSAPSVAAPEMKTLTPQAAAFLDAVRRDNFAAVKTTAQGQSCLC